MKKSTACVIFYSWTESNSDTRKIEKLRKFFRREGLSISIDKYECRQYKLLLPDDVLQFSEPFSQSNQMGFPVDAEHVYTVFFQYSDSSKLHSVVSLVQAYASYIGIHSQLKSWVVE